MKNKTSWVMSFVMSLVMPVFMVLAASSFAAEQAQSAGGGPDKETRKQMAKVHEKMAKCLKSDRPISECRKEMKSNCSSSMMKDGHCEMMGGHDSSTASESESSE